MLTTCPPAHLSSRNAMIQLDLDLGRTVGAAVLRGEVMVIAASCKKVLLLEIMGVLYTKTHIHRKNR